MLKLLLIGFILVCIVSALASGGDAAGAVFIILILIGIGYFFPVTIPFLVLGIALLAAGGG